MPNPVSVVTMLPSHNCGGDGTRAACRAWCSAVGAVNVSPVRRALNVT
ncbi:hypothetical protein ACFPRL_06690 [Pseudoclavibacter helvolus]